MKLYQSFKCFYKFSLSVNFLVYFLLFNLSSIFETKAQNNDILSATQMVNQDSIKSYIQHLENYGTRFMIAPNRLEIAVWLQNKFKSLGIDSVRIDTFQTQTIHQNLALDTVTKQYNVVATISGSSKKKLIICGHYDCFAYGDPFTVAPGADDDASGIAACLESARIFSEINYLPEHTIEIIAFAAEELMNSGLGGYDIHAANALANNDSIDLVIHNDMIGFNDGYWSIFLSNYPGCESETAFLASVSENYTSLNTHFWPSTLGPFADRAFYDRGYKCVYVEENFDANPNYHSVTDLLSNMDVAFCAEATKISIGGIMQYDISSETTSTVRLVSEKAQFSIYPNPILNNATISYNLEKDSYIELNIFDVTGQKIKTIVSGITQKGNNIVEFENENFQGIYFISLSIDKELKYTQKVIFQQF